ncbi:MAG: NADH-quinone oxidoreductase subunit C [Dehalococcoidales bacterium]|nr:NADH-quinone oxidoreductase subunit C [Dehalococcoidales bacterium]
MTIALSGTELGKRLAEKFPGSIVESIPDCLLVNPSLLPEVAGFLKDIPDLDFNYLNYITSVDYYEYFEVIYRLTSTKYNHSIVLKARCYDRENPVLPSVTELWQGANFQEREIYDLMGIRFEGHPNLKRLLLWDGFAGHPLRKDYL